MSAPTKRKRCAFYQRVSRRDQNPENQAPSMRQLATTRGLEVVQVFEEKASAAKKRPVYEEMMKLAHRGSFDVLVVWSLDRLGRSLVGNMTAVLELDRLGIEIVSVTEPWLSNAGPVRDLLIAIFSWCAQQERARLIERTHEGLATARRKGTRLGRKPHFFDVAKARALRAEGQSIRAVATAVGAPRSVVARELARLGVPKSSTTDTEKSGRATSPDEGPKT